MGAQQPRPPPVGALSMPATPRGLQGLQTARRGHAATPRGTTPLVSMARGGHELLPSAAVFGGHGGLQLRPCTGPAALEPLGLGGGLLGAGRLPAVRPEEAGEESFEQLTAIEPAWQWLVLPAVTWLYSWVEWHMQASGHELPNVIQQAHRAAVVSASEHASKFKEVQPDGLAASVWRSMLSLVLHFMARVEPLMVRLQRASEEADEALARVESLQETLDAQERQAREQQERLQSELDALHVTAA